MQLVFDLAQHDLVDVQAALKAFDLRAVLTRRLLLPTEEETFVQILLQLSSLELCLQSKIAHWLLTRSNTSIVLRYALVSFPLFNSILVFVKPSYEKG